MKNRMYLFVAGVVHQDPLGPRQVRRWLSELLLRYGEPPSFVAAEWDEAILARIISQRPRLAELVQAEWPSASEDFIQALADAMGYEGDSHRHLLPSAKTVWLDAGSSPNEEEVERFAELRFSKYKLLATGLQNFDSEGLEQMSSAAWINIEPRDEGPNPRDDKFARRLFTACETGANKWAIAILGINHAIDTPGSAIDLLIHNGISCHVTKMAPSHIST